MEGACSGPEAPLKSPRISEARLCASVLGWPLGEHLRLFLCVRVCVYFQKCIFLFNCQLSPICLRVYSSCSIISCHPIVSVFLVCFGLLGSLRPYGPLDPSGDFVLHSLRLLRPRDDRLLRPRLKMQTFLHPHGAFSSPLHV